MTDDRYQKLTKVLLGVGLDFAAYGIDEFLLDKEQLASDWNALLRARTKQILELEAVRREKSRVKKRKQRKIASRNNGHVPGTVPGTEPEEVTVEDDREHIRSALVIYAGTAIELAEKISSFADLKNLTAEAREFIHRAAAAWAQLDRSIDHDTR